MLDILRDGVWQFIGVILTVVMGLWIYYLQKPRKRLLVERVARVPLTTVGSDGVPGLQILFNGEAIANASVTVIRVENIGNSPISSTDFEQPISFSFETDAVVLHARTVDMKPTSLAIEPLIDGQKVMLSKALLNPGDSLTCRVLVRNSKGAYAPGARVIGMKDLETKSASSNSKFALIILICLVVVFASGWLAPTPHSEEITQIRRDEIPYVLVMLLAGLVSMAAFVRFLTVSITRLQRSIRHIFSVR